MASAISDNGSVLKGAPLSAGGQFAEAQDFVLLNSASGNRGRKEKKVSKVDLIKCDPKKLTPAQRALRTKALRRAKHLKEEPNNAVVQKDAKVKIRNEPGVNKEKYAARTAPTIDEYGLEVKKNMNVRDQMKHREGVERVETLMKQAALSDQRFDENAIKHKVAEHNRAGYKSRQAKPLTRVTAIMQSDAALTTKFEVYHAGSRRRCKHGLRHNRVKNVNTEVKFFCDHDILTKIFEKDHEEKCYLCGAKMQVRFTNPQCGCSGYQCPRCKSANYNYDGKFQPFDKHIDDYVVFTEEKRETDFAKFLQQHTVTKIDPKEDENNEIVAPISYAAVAAKTETRAERRKAFRKKFLDMLAKKEALNDLKRAGLPSGPTQVAVSEQLAKEGKSLGFCENLVRVRTEVADYRSPPEEIEEEGGAISSTGKLAKDTMSSFRSWFLETINDIEDRIAKKVASLAKKHITSVFGKRFVKAMEVILHFLRVICDYVWSLDACEFLTLWDMVVDHEHHSTIGSTARGLFYAAHVISKLASYEEIDRALLRGVLRDPACMDKLRALIPELGPLKTIFKGKIDSMANKTLAQRVRIIDNMGFISSARSGSAYTVLTNIAFTNDQMNEYKDYKEEAGDKETGFLGSIWDGLCSVASCFMPNHLMKSAKKVLPIIKDLIPFFTLIKGAKDVTVIVKSLIDKVWDALTSHIKDPREWLSLRIHADGNPIHDSVALYLAYMQTVEGKNADDASTLRVNFYSKLNEADKYALEQKHFPIWLTLRKRLDDNMITPPKPKTREYAPTTVMFSGASGAGKSTFWPAIVSQAMSKRYPTLKGKELLERIREDTYTWNINSEYNPGLSKAKIVLFDDFAQARGENVEQLALIQLSTCAPSPINSANISGFEIKGMFADPDMLVICTNVDATLAAQQLSDSDALIRRLDVNFEIKKKFDPLTPDEPIAVVRNCADFASIIGKQVNLAEMREIVSVLHFKKRQRKKEVDAMVVSTLDQQVEALDLCSSTFPSTNETLWQGDADFAKAFQEYKAATKATTELPKEEKGKITKTVSSFTARVREAFNNRKKGEKLPLDEILEEAGESFTSALLQAAGSFLTMGVLIGVPASIARGLIESFADITTGFASPYPIPWKRIITKTLTYIGLGLGGIITAALIMKKTLGYSEDSASGQTKSAKAQTVVAAQPKRLEAGGEEEEEAKELILNEDIAKKINKNIALIVVDGRPVNGLFIQGSAFITVRHIFLDRYNKGKLIRDGTEVLFRLHGENNFRKFYFEKSRAIAFGSPTNTDVHHTEDIIMYNIPANIMPPQKSILHFVRDTYDTEILIDQTVSLLDYVTPISDLFSSEERRVSGKITERAFQDIRKEGKFQRIQTMCHASYPRRSGACGSPVVSHGSTSILGIHMAGGVSTGTSFFAIIERDSLKAGLEMLGAQQYIKQAPLPELFEEEVGDVSYLPPRTTLQPIATSTYFTVYQPTITDLQPSILYSVPELSNENSTQPSILSWKDLRFKQYCEKHDVEWNSLSFARILMQKTTGGYVNVPQKALIWSVGCLKDRMRRIFAHTEVPNFTEAPNLHRALNGYEIPGQGRYPGATRMDMSTSTGFPYPGSKKEYFEDVTHGEKHILQIKKTPKGMRIERDYLEAIASIKRGEVPFLPFCYMLKDERLKKKKIDEVGTRLFGCASVVHYLVMRTYFEEPMLALYNNKFSNEGWSIPSLDRLSLQWHHMMEEMIKVGRNGFDFDFKNYDRNLSYTLIYESIQILLHTVNITQIEKDTLATMMAAPYVIFRQTVFLAPGFNMSGNLLTYTMNCLINEILHMSAYYDIMMAHKNFMWIAYATYGSYREHVRGIRGGDDTFTTVSDEISEVYNGSTVADKFLEWGLEVTSADKLSFIRDLKPFTEIIFLKNKTRIENGKMLPLPDLDSLKESARWVRINKHNPSKVEAANANIRASLYGIFFHGREVYDSIKRACEIEEPLLVLPHYDELYYMFVEIHEFPGAAADYATDYVQRGVLKRPTRISREMGSDVGRSEPNEDMNTEMNKIRIHFNEDWKTGKLQEVIEWDAGEDIAALASAEQLPKVPMDAVALSHTTEQIVKQDGDTKEKTQDSTTGTHIQDVAQKIEKKMVTGKGIAMTGCKALSWSVNDIPWSLETFLSKYTLTARGTWSITDAVGTTLKSLNIPTDLLVTPAIKIPFDSTHYSASAVTLTIVLTGAPGYSGSLLLAFGPYGQEADLVTGVNTGGMIINVSEEEGGQFTIDHRYYMGYLTVPEQNLGTVRLLVQNQLRAGTALPNSITYSIYSKFETSVLKVPDIIPGAFYKSYKFHSIKNEYGAPEEEDQPITVIEMPIITGNPTPQWLKEEIQEEAGDYDNSKESIALKECHINDPVGEIVTTKLCAGVGMIPRETPMQFADTPVTLIDMMKRVRTVGSYRLTHKRENVFSMDFKLLDLYKVAMGTLSDMYSFFRGSLQIYAFLSADGRKSLEGRIGLFESVEVVPTKWREFCEARIDGYSIFTEDMPGQVYVPWMFQTFTAPISGYETSVAVTDPVLNIAIYNNTVEDCNVFLELYVGLGDDFTTGVFGGSPDRAFPDIANVTPSNLQSFPIEPQPTKKKAFEDFVNIIRTTTPPMRAMAVTKQKVVEESLLEFADKIIENVHPVLEIADAFANALDQTPVSMPPEPVQNRKYPQTISTHTPHFLERLKTLTNNNMVQTPRNIYGMAINETNIDNLMKFTKSPVFTIEWKDTDPVGKVLLDIPIGPMKDGRTMHDTIPQLFTYWTGSTIYLVNGIPSKFSRGQLIMAVAYNKNSAPDYKDVTQTYFSTMDISAGHSTAAFEAPYLHQVPYALVDKPKYGSGLYLTSPGRFVIYVASALRTLDKTNAASSIDLNVYKYYGSDFRLAIPGSLGSITYN